MKEDDTCLNVKERSLVQPLQFGAFNLVFSMLILLKDSSQKHVLGISSIV